jgi:hypothetical protein
MNPTVQENVRQHFGDYLGILGAHDPIQVGAKVLTGIEYADSLEGPSGSGSHPFDPLPIALP